MRCERYLDTLGMVGQCYWAMSIWDKDKMIFMISKVQNYLWRERRVHWTYTILHQRWYKRNPWYLSVREKMPPLPDLRFLWRSQCLPLSPKVDFCPCISTWSPSKSLVFNFTLKLIIIRCLLLKWILFLIPSYSPCEASRYPSFHSSKKLEYSYHKSLPFHKQPKQFFLSWILNFRVKQK